VPSEGWPWLGSTPATQIGLGSIARLSLPRLNARSNPTEFTDLATVALFDLDGVL